VLKLNSIEIILVKGEAISIDSSMFNWINVRYLYENQMWELVTRGLDDDKKNTALFPREQVMAVMYD
tara:strand:+ start:270 stop:470 length:201 start_codon:yes stop_codon:yes gene_type:complete